MKASQSCRGKSSKLSTYLPFIRINKQMNNAFAEWQQWSCVSKTNPCLRCIHSFIHSLNFHVCSLPCFLYFTGYLFDGNMVVWKFRLLRSDCILVARIHSLRNRAPVNVAFFYWLNFHLCLSFSSLFLPPGIQAVIMCLIWSNTVHTPKGIHYNSFSVIFIMCFHFRWLSTLQREILL